MKKTFYRALVSATTKAEARKILLALASQKLVAGGLITSGESTYWWQERLVTKRYYNLSMFTAAARRRKIIATVEKLHADEVPIIAFFKISSGNESFLRWIDRSTSGERAKRSD